MPCTQPFRGDTSQLLLYKIASCCFENGGGGGGSGVTSFNGRTGAVTLTSGDVTSALGFTPISQADGDARYVLKAGDTMTGALTIGNGVLVASAPALNLNQTWNNGAVTFNGLFANYTNTASASDSSLFNFQTDGIDRFRFNTVGQLFAARQDATTSGMSLFLRKRGNSVGATNAVAADSTVGTVQFSSWDGTAYANGSRISGLANQAWTNVAHGSRIDLYTTPDGSTTEQITLRLAATGQALFLDGTAALPALSFQNDTNTGLYRIGADIQGFSTAGVERMRINAAGNVGIGTSPDVLLHIASSTADAARFRITETGDTLSSHFSGLGLYDGAAFKAGMFKRGNDHALCFFDATQTRITMLQGGFTGISEPVPVRVLHVTGAAADTARIRVTEMLDSTSGHLSGLEISDAGTFKGAFFKTGDLHSLQIWDASSPRITVLQGGNVGIGTVSPSTGLTLGTAVALAMNSGANQRCGDAVLVAGTVTVANTSVTANTRVFVSRKTAGGTPGTEFVYTLIAATSFTITSDNAADTSTVSYLLIEVP